MKSRGDGCLICHVRQAVGQGAPGGPPWSSEHLELRPLVFCIQQESCGTLTFEFSLSSDYQRCSTRMSLIPAFIPILFPVWVILNCIWFWQAPTPPNVQLALKFDLQWKGPCPWTCKTLWCTSATLGQAFARFWSSVSIRFIVMRSWYSTSGVTEATHPTASHCFTLVLRGANPELVLFWNVEQYYSAGIPVTGYCGHGASSKCLGLLRGLLVDCLPWCPESRMLHTPPRQGHLRSPLHLFWDGQAGSGVVL